MTHVKISDFCNLPLVQAAAVPTIWTNTDLQFMWPTGRNAYKLWKGYNAVQYLISAMQ